MDIIWLGPRQLFASRSRIRLPTDPNPWLTGNHDCWTDRRSTDASTAGVTQHPGDHTGISTTPKTSTMVRGKKPDAPLRHAVELMGISARQGRGKHHGLQQKGGTIAAAKVTWTMCRVRIPLRSMGRGSGLMGAEIGYNQGEATPGHVSRRFTDN